MLRKHENTVSWKAGILAIAVHAVLLVAMLVSFNWKAAHTVLNVTEVELWDKIPQSNPPVVVEEPKPEPEPEPPVVKEEPKPEPVVEEKPKVEEPKVDIELEKKKKELEQKEVEQKQKELDDLRKKEALDKIKQEAREDQLRDKKAAEKQEKLERDKALRKLQEDMSNENGADEAKASSAANASLIGEYKAKIQAKIKNNVNKTLCGDGSPEIRIEISVLPTGQIGGTPKITKSSGNEACDGAVERAIIASEPLPLPDDPELKAQFRNLNLKFTPND
jgi:colicin import membrane protein